MSTEMYNETELLKASMQGDTVAFEAIVKKYQSFICAITFSATADFEKSEDLAQETFISAWKNLAQLKDLNKFKGWLSSIARNIIRNSFRSRKQDLLQKSVSLNQVQEDGINNNEPSEVIITKEQKAVVQQALKQIPQRYREPLVLFYREQQSVKQVAEELDLSAEAAKQRLSRGRKMLKEQVAAVVETTISRTGPSKIFTTAVIASVGGIAIKSSVVAAAASIGTATSTAGTTTGVAAIMSGITAKIITVAAVVAIGIGTVIAYKQLSKKPEQPQASAEESIQQPSQKGEHLAKSFIISKEQRMVKAADVQETVILDKKTNSSQTIETNELNEKTNETVVAKNTFVFKPKGVLSGVITDRETSEPVTDARVTLGGSSTNMAETDSNGFYYFEEKHVIGGENFRVGVTSKEYVGITDYDSMPRVSLQKSKQFVKHFQLEKACMIDVLVLDHNSNPIEKTFLFAASLADERKKEIGDQFYAQMTDENGYVRLGGFRPAKTPYLAC